LLQEGIVVTALIGYFGFILKDFPMFVFAYFKQKYSFSVTFAEKHEDVYRCGIKWINEFNSKTILRHSMPINFWEGGKPNIILSINYGVYSFFRGLNYIVVSKTQVANNGYNTDFITVQVFGKDSLKYKKSLEESIKSIDYQNYLSLKINDGNFFKKIEKRSFDSVFCKEKNEILDSIKRWQNNKDLFMKHGINYKLGLLLYGCPGTGKSSVARAIATYLDWQLVFIDLKNSSYAELTSALNSINPKQVVLLEDIDCAVGDRETDGVARSFELLLQILDGALSPTNVVFIATTNYIEKLDSAFLREGRFDYKFKFDDFDYNLASKMCEAYGLKPKDILENEAMPINPAYLQVKLLNTCK